jgi:sulfhydrogenase subunit alpha
MSHIFGCTKSIEDAIGLVPSEQTMTQRRLAMWAHLIRDHPLHLYFFVLPDLFDKGSVFDFTSPEEKKIIATALEIKAAGNNLSKMVAGRSIHAPWPVLGGFTQIPDRAKYPNMLHDLEHAREHSLELLDVFYGCPWKFEHDTNYVAMVGPKFDYLSGDLVSSSGLKIAEKDFDKYAERIWKDYSTASAFLLQGKDYMVGSMSRLNLGKKFLHGQTQKDCAKQLVRFPSKNVYDNDLAQAIETIDSINQAIDVLESTDFKPEAPVQPSRKDGTGFAVVEAPRGVLYYNVAIKEGKVQSMSVAIPTGQNQVRMEKDLEEMVQQQVDAGKDKDYIVHEMEKLIRAYDPCMSCATHFLKVKWKK